MAKKQPALSPWFPASINPARKGVYEVIYSGDGNPEHRTWDGAHWTHADGVKCGFNMRLAGDVWRGLAQQPKGARRG